MAQENQRVTVTKRMLREGLLRLLEEKELNKITITELCKEAGINRITFYRHYETPRDVLLDLEEELKRELKLSLKVPKTLEEVKEYMEELCAFLDTHIDLLKIMIRNNTDIDFCSLFQDFFVDVYREGTYIEMLKNVDPDALHILAICSAGSSYFLMRQWLLGNIKKTPQEIAAIFYNQLCNTDWVSVSKRLGLM